MHDKIALAGPDITEKEVAYVIDAVKNGWYKTYDIHIKKLERTFAEYVQNMQSLPIAVRMPYILLR